jgi:hypothetical protein
LSLLLKAAANYRHEPPFLQTGAWADVEEECIQVARRWPEARLFAISGHMRGRRDLRDHTVVHSSTHIAHRCLPNISPNCQPAIWKFPLEGGPIGDKSANGLGPAKPTAPVAWDSREVSNSAPREIPRVRHRPQSCKHELKGSGEEHHWK